MADRLGFTMADLLPQHSFSDAMPEVQDMPSSIREVFSQPHPCLLRCMHDGALRFTPNEAMKATPALWHEPRVSAGQEDLSEPGWVEQSKLLVGFQTPEAQEVIAEVVGGLYDWQSSPQSDAGTTRPGSEGEVYLLCSTTAKRAVHIHREGHALGPFLVHARSAISQSGMTSWIALTFQRMEPGEPAGTSIAGPAGAASVSRAQSAHGVPAQGLSGSLGGVDQHGGARREEAEVAISRLVSKPAHLAGFVPALAPTLAQDVGVDVSSRDMQHMIEQGVLDGDLLDALVSSMDEDELDLLARSGLDGSPDSSLGPARGNSADDGHGDSNSEVLASAGAPTRDASTARRRSPRASAGSPVSLRRPQDMSLSVSSDPSASLSGTEPLPSAVPVATGDDDTSSSWRQQIQRRAQQHASNTG